jgi:hypothetical protein
MERSPAARMTHSYARIMFVLGPSLTTTRSDSASAAEPNTARWRCGCSSTGPFRSMVWTACDVHAHYTEVLNEDRTSTLLSAWSESAGMRFGDHNARWSFDPSNAYCEKQFRDEYLSILHACGTIEGDFFAAELIYRELISNALRHAPGKVNVELQWSEPYPVLSVHDHSDLFSWTGDLPLNPLTERGRGLYLVNSFAWGLRIKDSVGQGYKVSAVLPVERKCDLANLFDFPNRQS